MTVKLGSVEFQDFEIPERLTFGGEQRLAVHELLGGGRVVDAIGAQTPPLAWAGRFRGGEAISVARDVDAIRLAGKPVVLTWADFRYSVIVHTFEADYERASEIPYRITCEVVADQSNLPAQGADTDLDTAFNDDLSASTDYASSIGDPALVQNLSDLSSVSDGVAL